MLCRLQRNAEFFSVAAPIRNDKARRSQSTPARAPFYRSFRLFIMMGRIISHGGGMTASEGAAISLRDVDVAFGLARGSVYKAVENASLSVADGEFVSIVGPTGCGKSTLLNIAAGLRAPSSGRVDIFGAPLASLNRRAGYLFQADALFPWKTAIENVAIGLDIAGVPTNASRERARIWLARVGLMNFGDRYPHMLSGGQRKRVGLAQVLIRDPKILLMDEPFGPLDAQTRQIMGNLLLDLWQADRKAVLFVTHDLEEAIALSDRVVIMSAGPAARIIGDWKVPLARPRDIAEIKLDAGFRDLYREIWSKLKEEVVKTYGVAGAEP
jgi:NitT/TauT family transport system ATP-binding protein